MREGFLNTTPSAPVTLIKLFSVKLECFTLTFYSEAPSAPVTLIKLFFRK